MAVRPSVIQHYILGAMRRAEIEQHGKHGTFWIGTPFFETVGILSDDPAQALADLYRSLEHVVLARLQHGGHLPVIDDIDFSDADIRLYAAHHVRVSHVVQPDQAWFETPEWRAKEREADAEIEAGDTEFFADEVALDRALEMHGNAG